MSESHNTQVHMTAQPPLRRDWGSLLLHRWPTLLGITVALLTAFDQQIDRNFVSFVAALIVVMPLVYLGAAVLERRSSAWLVLLAGLVLLVPLRLFDMTIVAAFVLLVLAFAFLVLSIVREQWGSTGNLLLQTIGMIAFSAVALVALYAQLDWVGYLLAAALLGHATWDAMHWWRNRVVPRSYAEFCAVLDLVLGVGILVMM